MSRAIVTAAPTETDLASRLALTIGRINRRMRSTSGEDLSHGLLSALSSLVRAGQLRLNELAACEHLVAPAATRIVAELERRKLAWREVDPQDRRSFLIRPTTAGVELLLNARSQRAGIMATLLAELDEGERVLLRDCLKTLEKLATITPTAQSL